MLNCKLNFLWVYKYNYRYRLQHVLHEFLYKCILNCIRFNLKRKGLWKVGLRYDLFCIYHSKRELAKYLPVLHLPNKCSNVYQNKLSLQYPGYYKFYHADRFNKIIFESLNFKRASISIYRYLVLILARSTPP